MSATDWRTDGAGEDPAAFYSEVEPKVTKLLKTLRDEDAIWEHATHEIGQLLGFERLERDWRAFAASAKIPAGRDVSLWLVNLAAREWPKPGDKRLRLYHHGAPGILAKSIGLNPPSRKKK